MAAVTQTLLLIMTRTMERPLASIHLELVGIAMLPLQVSPHLMKLLQSPVSLSLLFTEDRHHLLALVLLQDLLSQHTGAIQ